MPARLSERELYELADGWSWGRVGGEKLREGSRRRLLQVYRAFLRRRWLRRCVVLTGRYEQWRAGTNRRPWVSLEREVEAFQRSQRREKAARLDYEAAGGRGWVTSHLHRAGNLTMRTTPGAWKGIQGGLGL